MRNFYLISVLFQTCVIMFGCTHSSYLGKKSDSRILDCLKTTCKISSEKVYQFKNTPVIGYVDEGEPIFLGGFSGLWFDERKGNDLFFYTITDRGPNGNEIKDFQGQNKDARIFLLPTFVPEIVYFKINLNDDSGTVEIIQRKKLKKNDENFSGLPIEKKLANGKNEETPIDVNRNILNFHKNGIDPEGICRDRSGNFWISEEYGPDLLQFDRSLNFLQRLTPGNQLPLFLEKRKKNRGFEAIACWNSSVFALLQSPMSLNCNNKNVKNSFSTLIQWNTRDNKVDAAYWVPFFDSLADKFGDMVALDQTNLLAIEQNGNVGENSVKNIVNIQIKQLENNHISDFQNANPCVDSQIDSAKIFKGTLTTKAMLDLKQTFIGQFEKLEGISLIDNSTLAVINDNDFAVDTAPENRNSPATTPKQKSFISILKIH